MSAIAQSVEQIVGSSNVLSWEALDLPLKQRIQAALRSEQAIDCVVYPQTVEELSEVVACAHRNQWRLLPCGNGSKLHWGGLAEGIQLIVSTTRLNRLIEHAVGDLTITAEAGMGFLDLQGILTQAGQFLALDPTQTQSATLGGIISTADAGALRQRYGGVRDMLIGISLVRSDGQVVKAGGRVVKNVAGYDLMKLMTGAYGTLGILSQVTFRVYPLPEQSQTVILTGEPGAIAQAMQTVLASALTPTSVDLLAGQTLSDLEIPGKLALAVRFQSLAVSTAQQATQLLKVAEALGLKGTLNTDEPAHSLWQQLSERMTAERFADPITCKIGVLPNQAIALFDKILSLAPDVDLARIHAASGLGLLRLNPATVAPQTVLDLRRLCETCGGFLSVLEAPALLKRRIDVWGYSGDALAIMKQLKQQFDPQSILSPNRFIGGI